MKAKVRKGIVHLWLPLIDPPRKSKSGKTMLLATSNGPKRIRLNAKGKTAVAIVSVYVRPEGYVKPRHRPIGRRAARIRQKRRRAVRRRSGR